MVCTGSSATNPMQSWRQLVMLKLGNVEFNLDAQLGSNRLMLCALQMHRW